MKFKDSVNYFLNLKEEEKKVLSKQQINFVSNYLNDKAIFGDEVTNSLYEDYLKELTGKSQKALVENLSKATKGILTESDIKKSKMLTEEPWDLKSYAKTETKIANPFSKAKEYHDYVSKDLKPNQSLDKLIDRKEFISRPGSGDLVNLQAKIQSKHGGIFDALKSGGQKLLGFLGKGFGWMAQNPGKVFAIGGGAALLAILVRNLKKKKQLDKYAKLKAFDEKVLRDYNESNKKEPSVKTKSYFGY
jgi:superoxide dismutase